MTKNIDGKTAEAKNKIFKAILYGQYKPGDKLPGERIMAEQNQISRVTLRRAYAELEQQEILERIHGHGTRVAQCSLANKNTDNTIGLLINGKDRFAWDFIRAVEKVVSDNGGILALRLTDDDADLEEQAAIDFVGNGIQNLVVWPSGVDFKSETFARLRILGTNMVFFDRMLPGDYADYVGLDNFDVIEQLFQKAGEIKKPLFLNHSIPFDSDKLREKYFVEKCQKLQIEATVKRVDYGELSQAFLQKFDAIFCVNDDMAMQVYEISTNIPIFSIDGFFKKVISYRQPMNIMAEKIISLIKKQQKSGKNWKSSRVFEKGEICEKEF